MVSVVARLGVKYKNFNDNYFLFYLYFIFSNTLHDNKSSFESKLVEAETTLFIASSQDSNLLKVFANLSLKTLSANSYLFIFQNKDEIDCLTNTKYLEDVKTAFEKISELSFNSRLFFLVIQKNVKIISNGTIRNKKRGLHV